MRREIQLKEIKSFMTSLGKLVKEATRVYFVGGTSAIFCGWRNRSADLDLKIVPDNHIYQVIADLKKQLNISIKLASPEQFIPSVSGWQERSVFIDRYGRVDFFHFDFYMQALAKLERGFNTDLLDVEAMVSGGYVELEKLCQYFNSIEGELVKFPAIDPDSYRENVEKFAAAISCKKTN